MGILQAHTFPALNGAERACQRRAPRAAAPRKIPRRACQNAPARRANHKQKTRLSAFFDCGSNPPRKAPSCAFNGAERACPNHKQKTRLSAGSNRFKWWT